MTKSRAISLSILGLWLLGCGSTADGDDDSAQAGAGTGGAMTVTEGGRGNTGTGGSSAGTSGASNNGGTMSTAGSGGTNAMGGSGGRGGDNQGGRSAGGAGSGGTSAGAGGTEMMSGAGGEAGRGMGGRMAMGGRAMGGAGGRSMAGMSGMGGMPMNGGAGGGLSNCPASGHVTYTLTKNANPTADEQQAYDLITTAMDKAIQYYNCYTNITKADTVTYVPSVQTADGSSNGSIRFGGKDYMEYITAMHEIAHTVGIGTSSQWPSLVVNGIFTGEQATAKLREITGVADDQVHADTQHFWPYGLNYTSEVKSEADVIDHCYMVVAIRADLGLK